ncbi:hypothetical protein AAHC03_024498 [Spirometra sp. Aus1]
MKRDSRDNSAGTPPAKVQKSDSPKVTVRFLIPARAAGLIIGKGGENIKKIRSQYSVKLNIPDNRGIERVFTVEGELSAIANVVREIVPKIKKHKMRVIKVYQMLAPLSTDRVVQLVAEPENAINCMESVIEVVESTPIRGAIENYDSANSSEVDALTYGGWLTPEGHQALTQGMPLGGGMPMPGPEMGGPRGMPPMGRDAMYPRGPRGMPPPVAPPNMYGSGRMGGPPPMGPVPPRRSGYDQASYAPPAGYDGVSQASMPGPGNQSYGYDESQGYYQPPNNICGSLEGEVDVSAQPRECPQTAISGTDFGGGQPPTVQTWHLQARPATNLGSLANGDAKCRSGATTERKLPAAQWASSAARHDPGALDAHATCRWNVNPLNPKGPRNTELTHGRCQAVHD